MKLKTPLIASIGALLLVGALFLSLVLSTAAYRPEEAEITLPSDADKAPQGEQVAGRNLLVVAQTEISAENIQSVVASLSRPDSYTATVTSRLYYGEHSGARTCRQSVKGGASRVDYLTASGATEHTELLWNGMLYAWRSGESSYFEGKQGAFTTDQSAMLPTYETVCALPAEQITGGALTQEGEELLLTVETREGDRAGVYKISVQTGLLRSASFSQNGKAIRLVEVAMGADVPADGLFVLPGGVHPVFGAAATQN